MSFILSLHFPWLILVAVNIIIQLAYFHNDRNRGLFIAKKVTTPLLLFFGMAIVVVHTRYFPEIPCAILAAMGLGEIGIEGSSIVESGDENDDRESRTSITVVLAGVLFLLVNVFIGLVLLSGNLQLLPVLSSLVIAVISISVILIFLFRAFKPQKETRSQIIIYSVGLAILFAGFLSDAFTGLSALGLAAAILTISDLLVLVRMAASFDKNTDSGFRILRGFLVTILVLYYVFIGLLIHLGSPFPG